MMTVIAFMAAIITVETALTDGTKSVDKMKVPAKDGVSIPAMDYVVSAGK